MKKTIMVGYDYGIELKSEKTVFAKDFEACKTPMLITSQYGLESNCVDEDFTVIYPPFKANVIKEGEVGNCGSRKCGIIQIECGDVKSLFEFYKEKGSISWLHDFWIFKEFKSNIWFLKEIEIDKNMKNVSRFEFESLYTRLYFKGLEEIARKQYSYQEFMKIIFEECDKRDLYFAQIQEVLESGKHKLCDGDVVITFGSTWACVKKGTNYVDVLFADLSLAGLEEFATKLSTI